MTLLWNELVFWQNFIWLMLLVFVASLLLFTMVLTVFGAHGLTRTLKCWAWFNGDTWWSDSRIVWGKRDLTCTLCLPPNIQVVHLRKLKTFSVIYFSALGHSQIHWSTNSPKRYFGTSSRIHKWNVSQLAQNKKKHQWFMSHVVQQIVKW